MATIQRHIPAHGARTLGGAALRALTAAGVLLSADIHLELWAQGFRDIRIIGPLFLLNAAGGLAVAVVLLAWRHWLPALAAAGFGAATLTAFAISLTAGLFGVRERLDGVPQWLAAVADMVAICCGLAFAVLDFLQRRSTARDRSGAPDRSGVQGRSGTRGRSARGRSGAAGVPAGRSGGGTSR